MKKALLLCFLMNILNVSAHSLFLKEEKLNYRIEEMPEYQKFKKECQAEIKYNLKLIQTNYEVLNQKLKRFFEYQDEKEFQRKILKLIGEKGCDAQYVQFNHAFQYLGHHQGLDIFQYRFYEFTDGNQGFGGNAYYVFNGQQELLSLDELFNPEEKVLLLNELLLEYTSEKMVKVVGADNQSKIPAEQLTSHNFYFNEKGLTFYYPPYTLDNTDENEYYLTVSYAKLKEILPENKWVQF